MIGNDWDEILKEEYQKEYFYNLLENVKKEYQLKKCYPEKENIFKALELCSYSNVKVVILGQDPYHQPLMAHGLSFSTISSTLPPSLKNIYKELESDLKINPSKSGNLTSWAKEGVLLLNSILTVVEKTPTSHKNIGWEQLTDEIIKKISLKKTPVVFILWGNYAKSKKKYINSQRHLTIESSHPSPYSAYNGFFGSKPFSKTNKYLIKTKQKPITWIIPKE